MARMKSAGLGSEEAFFREQCFKSLQTLEDGCHHYLDDWCDVLERMYRVRVTSRRGRRLLRRLNVKEEKKLSTAWRVKQWFVYIK